MAARARLPRNTSQTAFSLTTEAMRTFRKDWLHPDNNGSRGGSKFGSFSDITSVAGIQATITIKLATTAVPANTL